MAIGIYKITSPSGKVYIGQSKNIEKRFTNYRNLTNCFGQKKLYNSLLKYGAINHLFEILEECEIEHLNERERFFQEKFNCLLSGLNLVLTKTNVKKSIISEETRQKMSNCRIGKKNIMFGKTHSKEAREKISKTHKGRVLTDEHKYKISQNSSRHNKGKKISAEQKAKFRAKVLGRKLLSEHKSAIKIGVTITKGITLIDLNTGVFYYSINEYAHLYGINPSTLYYYVSGKRKNKTNVIIC